MSRHPQNSPTRAAVSALILLLTAPFACGPRHPPPVTRSFPAMGTVMTVIVPRTHRDASAAVTAVSRSVLADMESRLSVYRSGSDISRLAAAGTNPVRIAPDTHNALVAAKKYAHLSGGAFDITSGPLLRLWGFSGGAPPARLPTPGQINAARALVGCRHILLDNGTAALAQPGMSLDLGGLAKGLAVDRIYADCRDQSAFLLNLGGNIRVRGRPASYRHWRIGVRNPFDTATQIGVLTLTNGMAVATSGNYERFIQIEGRRYSHIIDPRSGRPVRGMAGVTAVCRSAGMADALSTALFVLGVTRGGTLLAGLPGSEAILVPDRKPLELHITPGLEHRFTPNPEHAAAVRVLHPASPAR
jgi:thiamine biosynthesis lipoprotein